MKQEKSIGEKLLEICDIALSMRDVETNKKKIKQLNKIGRIAAKVGIELYERGVVATR